MSLKELLLADVRKEGVWEEIHKYLFKIPPLSKYGPVGNIPLKKLEKVMWLFGEKYGIQLQYIMPVHQKNKKGLNEYFYSCSIKDKHDESWIGTIYGLDIYECYAKLVLMSYGYIKSKKK